MRASLFSLLCMLFFVQTSCQKDNINNTDATISAKINWSEDVTNLDMSALGIGTTQLEQNTVYNLKKGTGTISWKSAGVEHSETINVRDSGIEDSDDNVECEQEGEHEGDNVGCLFSLSISEDALLITTN
ncbi:MAG: hypothetical protein ABIO60_07820 [Aquaticitalea sp.]